MYKKIRSIKIGNIKKNIYIKDGSAKQYVLYKKKHISFTKYKRMKANKSKKCKRTKKGKKACK